MSKNNSKSKNDTSIENTEIEADTTNTTTAQIDANIDDELEALLADATVATAEEEEIDDKALEEIDAQAAIAASKEEAYAEQEGEVADPTAKVTPISAAKKPRTPRVSRAAGAKPSDVLAQVLDTAQLAQAACLVSGEVASEELTDSLMTTINGLAKKVGDKAVNLLRHNENPAKLQKYTVIGLNTLIAGGDATSRTFTDALMAAGYTIGTARSQANQLMSLLPALKVAEKNGRQLTLREDSVIREKFQAALAA